MTESSQYTEFNPPKLSIGNRPLPPHHRPTSASTNGNGRNPRTNKTRNNVPTEHVDDLLELYEVDTDSDENEIPETSSGMALILANENLDDGIQSVAALNRASKGPAPVKKAVNANKTKNGKGFKRSSQRTARVKSSSMSADQANVLEAAEMLTLQSLVTDTNVEQTADDENEVDAAAETSDGKTSRPKTATAASIEPSGRRKKQKPASAGRKKRGEQSDKRPKKSSSAVKRKPHDIGEVDDENTPVENFLPKDDDGDNDVVVSKWKSADEEKSREKSEKIRVKAHKNRKRRSNSADAQNTGNSQFSRKQSAQSNSAFRLSGSENPDIKTWLRKKNRQLRKQHIEERRRERQRKKEEEERAKQEEAKNRESAEKVAEWIKHKKQLTSETSASRSSATYGGNAGASVEKIAAAINSTLDLQITVKPIEVKVTSRQTPRTTTTDVENESPAVSKVNGQASVTALGAQMSATSSSTLETRAAKDSDDDAVKTIRRVGERIPSPRLSISPSHISLPQENRYPAAPLAIHSRGSPVHRPRQVAPNTGAPVTRSASSVRLSYDEWLKRKKIEQEAIRKRQASETSHHQHDDATETVIREVARHRIDAILSGRRRVDSGIRKTNETVNSRPGTCSSAISMAGDTRLLQKRRSSRDRSSLSLSLTTINFNAELSSGADQIEVNESAISGQPSGDVQSLATSTEILSSSSSLICPSNSSYVDATGGFDPAAPRSNSPRSWSAFPARPLRRRTANAGSERPSTADSVAQRRQETIGNSSAADNQTSAFSLDLSPTVTRLHAVAPRPTQSVVESPAYRSVRYQQRSWNGFADYVWDRVNEAEGGEMKPTTTYRLSLQVAPSDESGTPTAADRHGDGTAAPTQSGRSKSDQNQRTSKASRAVTSAGRRRIQTPVKQVKENTTDDVEPAEVIDMEDIVSVAVAKPQETAISLSDVVDNTEKDEEAKTSIAWAERTLQDSGVSETDNQRDTSIPHEIVTAVNGTIRRPSSSSVAGVGRVTVAGARMRRRLGLGQKSQPITRLNSVSLPLTSIENSDISDPGSTTGDTDVDNQRKTSIDDRNSLVTNDSRTDGLENTQTPVDIVRSRGQLRRQRGRDRLMNEHRSVIKTVSFHATVSGGDDAGLAGNQSEDVTDGKLEMNVTSIPPERLVNGDSINGEVPQPHMADDVGSPMSTDANKFSATRDRRTFYDPIDDYAADDDFESRDVYRDSINNEDLFKGITALAECLNVFDDDDDDDDDDDGAGGYEEMLLGDGLPERNQPTVKIGSMMMMSIPEVVINEASSDDDREADDNNNT